MSLRNKCLNRSLEKVQRNLQRILRWNFWPTFGPPPHRRRRRRQAVRDQQNVQQPSLTPQSSGTWLRILAEAPRPAAGDQARFEVRPSSLKSVRRVREALVWGKAGAFHRCRRVRCRCTKRSSFPKVFRREERVQVDPKEYKWCQSTTVHINKFWNSRIHSIQHMSLECTFPTLN